MGKQLDTLRDLKEDPVSRLSLEDLMDMFPNPTDFMEKFPAYIFKQIEKIHVENPQYFSIIDEMEDAMKDPTNKKKDKTTELKDTRERQEKEDELLKSKRDRSQNKNKVVMIDEDDEVQEIPKPSRELRKRK